MPFSGAIEKTLSAHRSVDGELSSNGNLASVTAAKVSIAGVIAFAGDLTSNAGRVLVEGILSFLNGSVSLLKNGLPVTGGKVVISKTVGRVIGRIINSITIGRDI